MRSRGVILSFAKTPSDATCEVGRLLSNYMTSKSFSWRVNTDVPVPGDYDGDGKTDPAVYRPSTGQWSQAGGFAQQSAIRSLDPSAAGAIGNALEAADTVLAAGDHLGPYEILGPVGAGGMGEVYKARDTWLDPSVAIKVLPSPLATELVAGRSVPRGRQPAESAVLLGQPI